MQNSQGFTEEQLAVIRAREKHAKDIAAQEKRDADRLRASSRREEPTPVAASHTLATIADILAQHGVAETKRVSFEDRIRPRPLSEQDRMAFLRQRLARDCPHKARERLFDAMGERIEPEFETKAMRAARYWLSRRTRSAVLFCGPYGTGKTTAAAWLALEYLSANPRGRVCWLRASQLVGAINFPGKDEDTPTLSDFVVVDDIGTEMQTPEVFSGALADLVERAGTRVVMTSNMIQRPIPGGGMSFREKYDGPEARLGIPGRLTSRLNEHVMAVDCKGADLRGDDGGF